MPDCAFKILVIGNDAVAAEAVHEALAEPGEPQSSVTWIPKLCDGVASLATAAFDAILLDLPPSKSQAIGSIDALVAVAGRAPIIGLTGPDNENAGQEAVRRGARECIPKENIDKFWLRRYLRHIVERAALDAALLLERGRAQIVLNSVGDGVIGFAKEGTITYLNPVAERITGWSRDTASLRRLSDVINVVDPDTHRRVSNPIQWHAHNNGAVDLPSGAVAVRPDGTEASINGRSALIHDESGKVAGAVIVFRNLRASQEMELKMSHLAQHDFLTGLPNRMLLNDRLNQAIRLARRHGSHVAVLFCDLDRFKHINDSLGHAVGDKMLQGMAKRLAGAVRATDTVSRQGGDEFVVVLSNIDRAHSAARHAARIQVALSAPHTIGELDLHMNVSIGISLFPDDGEDAETLIQRADTAMYQAKESGRNKYQFFTPEMNMRAIERQSLEASLRRALERREFVLHYQSKTNLTTGALTGGEALIRWSHPERGLVPPDQFVPIAEDCGLIVPIGRWVLREACQQARAWQKSGLRVLPIAVNISALEFRQKDFLAVVGAVLKETGLDAACLELEVTESVLMQNVESTTAVLRGLKSMGVLLSIDDFGTGYSSLSYLRQFPFDTLKIDPTFVRDIATDAKDAALVSAMIILGRSLQRRVMAEGVETREQLAFLKTHFCDEGQGYYFGRPVIASEFAELLRGEMYSPVAPRQVTAGRLSS